MIIACALFVVGLLLSAFFSGSETGLYRVSRTRLVLDALGGSRAAQGIVRLLNHPS
ncbi:MAG: CNNM domain-containing protein, partial [Pirellulales bacterium]|nr:CNNM domain-containing protein [Pirellulales bacterium]